MITSVSLLNHTIQSPHDIVCEGSYKKVYLYFSIAVNFIAIIKRKNVSQQKLN